MQAVNAFEVEVWGNENQPEEIGNNESTIFKPIDSNLISSLVSYQTKDRPCVDDLFDWHQIP